MASLPKDLDEAIRADLSKAVEALHASILSATDGMQAEVSYALPPVQKIAQQVLMSDEMAMECGLIPDTRLPVVITRRQRFRWWRQAKVSAIRLRLGELVAGQRFRDSEDY